MTPPSPALGDQEIRLRPWSLEDREAFLSALDDEDIARWTGFPYSASREDVEQLLTQRVAGWTDGSSATFAIEERPTGVILGSIGLLSIDWETARAEGGYWLSRRARGRGVATRSLRWVSAWALRDLRLKEIQLTTDTRNHASRRVAERSGYRFQTVRRGVRTLHGEPLVELVFTLLRAGEGDCSGSDLLLG